VLNGTPESIEQDVAEKLKVGIDIIGPECAVPLDATYENLKMIVAVAKRLSGEQYSATDSNHQSF
jgi:uroporphyrinogen-III decarboxylase